MTASRRSLWEQVRKRLRQATQDRGARSSLARKMGVSLATVSQWLTNDERQRIFPTAENTLLLLEWVTEEEAKQKKRAGSASTRPALKTRKRSSTSHEKAKSSSTNQ